VSGDKLSALQWNILGALAALEPAFTLTGGGALAGVHLGHRTTRDLDLFWRERAKLDDLAEKVSERLLGQGLTVSTIQTSQTFHRFQVADGQETCLIDLVAEPFSALVPPMRVPVAGNELLVDTSREILASKLTTLLSRSELRDLQDVKALLDAGGDLEQAVGDAAQKDGGFSPLTLAWVLRSFEIRPIAEAVGWSEEEVVELEEFQRWLLDQLAKSGTPKS